MSRGAPRTGGVLVLLGVGAAALGAGAATPAAAQVIDTTQTPVDSVVITPGADPEIVRADVDRALPISTRQAFIRSMVLPGWGQAAFGSYLRGGVFFTGWAANGFMIFRTQVRLNEARGLYDRRVDDLVDRIVASSAKPIRTRALLESTPALLADSIRSDQETGGANDMRKLVRAREQQREDWIAWSIFWVLASGVDGYVTAHLSDFPAAIEVRPGRQGGGAVSLGVTVPLPARDPPPRRP
ncbi:MAG: DUF5683 domain-containing protein [Gemmatimonadota bacterium]